MRGSSAGPSGRTRFWDVVRQAVAAVRGRSGRSWLTASGVGLGITAAIATLGISLSAANAVSDRFDALRSTLVTVKYPVQGHPAVPIHPPGDHRDRALRLNGVTAAGMMSTAMTAVPLSRLPARYGVATDHKLSLIAADPEIPPVLGAHLRAGRWADSGFELRRERVALVDTVGARALGIAVGQGPGTTIFVNQVPFTVLGVYAAAEGDDRLTGAVLLPYWSAEEQALAAAQFAPTEVVIRTRLGAAEQVGGEAPLALAPADPVALVPLVPADLAGLRQGVESETEALFLGLAAVSLLVGSLGVSNTMLVSVLERRPEIGLRRAVGASQRVVAAQFLLESGLIGLVGGLAGTVLGVNLTIGTCLIKGWLVVVDPVLLGSGPLAGMVVGTLAGVYPAVSAARIQPAESLRAG